MNPGLVSIEVQIRVGNRSATGTHLCRRINAVIATGIEVGVTARRRSGNRPGNRRSDNHLTAAPLSEQGNSAAAGAPRPAGDCPRAIINVVATAHWALESPVGQRNRTKWVLAAGRIGTAQRTAGELHHHRLHDAGIAAGIREAPGSAQVSRLPENHRRERTLRWSSAINLRI